MPNMGARPMPNMGARPSIPNMGARPNMNNMGNARPMNRPANLPSVSRPSVSRPMPATRPNINAPGNKLPNINAPGNQLPNVNMPNFNRPAGGIKPSIPSGKPNFPNAGLPNLPNIERPNISRPSVRPETKPGITGPITKPSFPNLGGQLPSNKLPNLPGAGGNLPGNKLPNLPDNKLPNVPGNKLPNLPDNKLPNIPGNKLPNIPTNKLPNQPGIARPLPGDLGDFLGLDRPVTLPGDLGTKPGTLPGITRPNLPNNGNRPNITLPNRPGDGNRPNVTLPSRPGAKPNWPNFGDINIGNNVINSKPGWVNINNNQINLIHNQWGNQIGGIQNWHNRYPDRMATWRNWGDHVRYNWNYHNHNWFRPSWWNSHHHGFCGWHYYHGFNTRPWFFWWSTPNYASFNNWFAWSAPAAVWQQPVYYDYGQGGNVVYQDNSVYINGQQIASADDFAQSAAVLATVAPPANEEQAAKVEWMPLGTFAVSSDEKDAEPTRIIQLAVSKEGIISGTLFNSTTDQANSVQGQVDKDTQRVAFRIGESEDVVVETGLYNLTQNETPVLVHFGKDRVETYLFVRMEASEEDKASID
jgi:hypothetical protein